MPNEPSSSSKYAWCCVSCGKEDWRDCQCTELYAVESRKSERERWLNQLAKEAKYWDSMKGAKPDWDKLGWQLTSVNGKTQQEKDFEESEKLLELLQKAR